MTAKAKKSAGTFPAGACNHPKVGIRPCIDGRRNGIRESLENQTMQMAVSAANLISSALRYEDGCPVDVSSCELFPSAAQSRAMSSANGTMLKV